MRNLLGRKGVTRVLVDGHLLKIGGGTLRYRGQDYPLDGVTARVDSTGWLVVDGPGFQFACQLANKNERVTYRVAEEINNAARRTGASPGSSPDGRR